MKSLVKVLEAFCLMFMFAFLVFPNSSSYIIVGISSLIIGIASIIIIILIGERQKK